VLGQARETDERDAQKGWKARDHKRERERESRERERERARAREGEREMALLLTRHNTRPDRTVFCTRNVRHQPPAVSADKEIEAYGLWKHSVDGQDHEIIISIYKAQPGKGSTPYATRDTNWGVLPEESISSLTHAEADEWRQRQKARVRAHVRCILQLAKMTTAPDVDTLMPLFWQVQVGMFSNRSSAVILHSAHCRYGSLTCLNIASAAM